jgi:hypothetical protein
LEGKNKDRGKTIREENWKEEKEVEGSRRRRKRKCRE